MKSKKLSSLLQYFCLAAALLPLLIISGCADRLQPAVPPTAAESTEPTAPLSEVPVLKNFDPEGVSAFAFHSDKPKSSIVSITFRDSLEDCPRETANVSESGIDRILMWMTDAGDNTWNLFIAGDGRIYLPEDARFLFGGSNSADTAYTSLREINFNNAVDASRVRDMRYLFQNCSRLTHLDMGRFPTRDTAAMDGLFLGCSTALELKTENQAVMDSYRSTIESRKYISDRTLRHDPDQSDAFLYGTEIRKQEVVSLTFLDSLQKAQASAVDVSANGSGKILMWAEGEENNYSLFIAGDGKIFFPADCCTLFGSFDDDSYALCNAESIHFGSAVDTSLVTSMEGLFSGCRKLKSLDLSSFDTGSVTKMNAMFLNCSNLRSLDLHMLDTRSVTSMAYMFSGCSLLKDVNLAGLHTNSLQRAESMFDQCWLLRSLDLSSFQTDTEINMNAMFRDCYALVQLTVGPMQSGSIRDIFSGCGPYLDLITEDADLLNAFIDSIAPASSLH